MTTKGNWDSSLFEFRPGKEAEKSPYYVKAHYYRNAKEFLSREGNRFKGQTLHQIKAIVRYMERYYPEYSI